MNSQNRPIKYTVTLYLGMNSLLVLLFTASSGLNVFYFYISLRIGLIIQITCKLGVTYKWLNRVMWCGHKKNFEFRLEKVKIEKNYNSLYLGKSVYLYSWMPHEGGARVHSKCGWTCTILTQFQQWTKSTFNKTSAFFSNIISTEITHLR